MSPEAIPDLPGDDAIGPLPPTPAKGPGPPERQISLVSLLVAIALIALFLGLIRRSPGLAVLLAVVAGPAFLVTYGRSAVRWAKGQPTSRHERIVSFAVGLKRTLVFIGCVAGILTVSLVALFLVYCTR